MEDVILQKNKDEFFVVGVGASAGGLEPLEILIQNLPPNTGCVFVIIQHLSPDHKSLMPEILYKKTSMKVLEAKNKVKVQPNHVYLIPPSKHLYIEDNTLILKDRPQGHILSLPIDEFFKSLAKEKKEKAVGIILSGTGTDGTLGIKAIKEENGLIIVQDPQESQFDGMPTSAIQTGMFDIILPVEKMVNELIHYSHGNSSEITSIIAKQEDYFLKILFLLKEKHHVDFGLYKRPTLGRRLAKRLTMVKAKTLAVYFNYLESHPKELQILFKEFLIGVTRFFRDDHVFKSLADNIIPEIFKNAPEDKKLIKVWITACSTGEEAYSVAILFREYMDKHNIDKEIKIYATDLDIISIQVASEGLYPGNISNDVPPGYLEKYFYKEGDGYKVTPELRQTLLFSKQDLTIDPPYSKMDMITCRNMLIYMEPKLQKKVIAFLHYALNNYGFLVLGTSESLGEMENHFDSVERHQRIFRKKNSSKALLTNVLTLPDRTKRLMHDYFGKSEIGGTKNPWNEEAQKALLSEFNSAYVIINERKELIEAKGEYTRYVKLPNDSFDLNLLKMVSEDMAPVLTLAISKAITKKQKVNYKDLKVKLNDEERFVNFSVHPLVLEPKESASRLMVIFSEVVNGEEKSSENKRYISVAEDSSRYIAELEEDLEYYKMQLQLALEGAEITHEELQATNEELVASNEELQSSNEELQSMNEEMHTVNVEFQTKNEELIELNEDMNNLINSTDIGTLFIDLKFQIKRFTPAIKRILNFIDSDIGRSIEPFKTKIGDVDIMKLIQDVIKNQRPVEQELELLNSAHYLLRLSPYLNKRNVFSGIVLSFIDISPLKLAEEEMKRQQKQLEEERTILNAILEGTMAGYWEWHIQEDYEYMSPRFKEMFGFEDEEVPNKPDWWQKQIHPDDLPGVFEVYNKHVNSKGEYPYDNEVRYYHKDGSIIWVYCRGKVIEWDAKGNPLKMVGSHVNITTIKKAQEEIEYFFNMSLDLVYKIDTESLLIHSSPSFETLLGWNKKELYHESFLSLVHTGDRQVVEHKLEELYSDNSAAIFKARLRHKDKSYRWFMCEIKPGPDGAFYGLAKDINQFTIDTEKLKRANDELEQFTYVTTHDIKAPVTNIASFVSMLKNHIPEDEKSKEYINWIEKYIYKAQQTILDLVETAKSIKSIDHLGTEDVALMEIFDEALNSLKIEIEASDAQISHDFKVLDVKFNKINARSIMYNLLSNAIKYRSPDRQIEIKVTSSEVEDYVCLSVEDNGLGIDLERDNEKVWGLFKRAHSHVDGIGIGLYLIKRAVENANGRVELESVVDKGSIFKVYFELQKN